nr:retrovirus-related Pol polyprotein from transposon 17.6 [Tanacetum cinerariifolium]
KADKSSIDEPTKVELKDLPPHLEYAFLEGDNKLPVIIAKDLSVDEKTALITEDFEPAVQNQRRVNPKIQEVIKNEVLKLLDAGLIYPISDSPWYYCFLDDFSGYFQIPIDPKDHEKTTFTCRYEMFAYHSMPFGLCNAPDTFQRCMMAIFHDMIEKTMEVFMDDCFVFGNSFQTCLSHLEKMLKRCEDTNLCLNWENSHFMVKEGIVLSHKISKEGIKFEKSKVDVIAKLPHPIIVKGIRSFLGHAGFYQVLGKRQEKNFRPIHYASKTMTEAESNYTTTEKEMLAVVYAFEKFRSYLIMNKSIVYTNHFALKHLFAKKDSKFATVMLKFGVTHRLATPYHPKTSGQVEVSNRALKRIFEWRVSENHASWSDKLDDALWAFRTAKKTRIRKVQLNELRNQSYENSLIYKEKTKRIHDSKIKDRIFNIGDRVLLFNSRLNIFSSKLKSHWSGPFTISHVFPHGIVELSQPDGPNFKVNGHRLKHYFGEVVPKMVVPDLQIFPKDQ